MPNAISMPNAIFIASAIVFAQYQPPQTRKSDHTKKTVYSGVQGKLIFITGGKTGIRTLGTKRHNGFRDRPDRPLRHLSRSFLIASAKLAFNWEIANFFVIFLQIVFEKTIKRDGEESIRSSAE